MQVFFKKSYLNRCFLMFFSISMLFLNTESAFSKGSKCPPMGKRLTVQQYCKLYSDMARAQMRKYGIPASITLAQGIHESGSGSSYLAVEANNHFGIKAYRGWNGPIVKCDDDRKSEPFCKFKSVEQGYEYHSTFLKSNTRYASLFKLKTTDYEGWSKGLQKCGYATNPKYSKILIRIIEENHLDAYDVRNVKVLERTHQLYLTAQKGGKYYIVCEDGDELANIAYEYDISERKLRKWNDLTKYSTLRKGDIIYLEKKGKKADKGFDEHTVKGGESLWSISQKYGITVKSLMKRNDLASATVSAGQVLRLR